MKSSDINIECELERQGLTTQFLGKPVASYGLRTLQVVLRYTSGRVSLSGTF